MQNSKFDIWSKGSKIVQLRCIFQKIFCFNDQKLKKGLAVLYIEFQKDFDKVHDYKGFAKLSALGLGGKALKMIADSCTTGPNYLNYFFLDFEYNERNTRRGTIWAALVSCLHE